ncbi:MAG: hypothetical protein ACFFAB_09800 [Candidatus Heimdallarchaeota archaeon]
MIFINFNCPCPKIGCFNHGNCKECTKYHLASNGLPFCKRNHGWFTKIFYRKNYELLQTLKAEGKV